MSNHFLSSPSAIWSGLVKTAVMCFIGTVQVDLLRLTNRSLARLVEFTNQVTTALVFRVGCRDFSAIEQRRGRRIPTFAGYYEKNQAVRLPDKLANELFDFENVTFTSFWTDAWNHT